MKLSWEKYMFILHIDKPKFQDNVNIDIPYTLTAKYTHVHPWYGLQIQRNSQVTITRCWLIVHN